jgi:hypothetical protein
MDSSNIRSDNFPYRPGNADLLNFKKSVKSESRGFLYPLLFKTSIFYVGGQDEIFSLKRFPEKHVHSLFINHGDNFVDMFVDKVGTKEEAKYGNTHVYFIRSCQAV